MLYIYLILLVIVTPPRSELGLQPDLQQIQQRLDRTRCFLATYHEIAGSEGRSASPEQMVNDVIADFLKVYFASPKIKNRTNTLMVLSAVQVAHTAIWKQINVEDKHLTPLLCICERVVDSTSLYQHIQDSPASANEAVSLLYWTAMLHKDKGQYELAEKHLLRAITLIVEQVEECSWNGERLCSGLFHTYLLMGKESLAKLCVEKAIQMRGEPAPPFWAQVLEHEDWQHSDEGTLRDIKHW